MAQKKWSHLKEMDGVVRHIGSGEGTSDRRARVNGWKDRYRELEDAGVLSKMAECKAAIEKLEEQAKAFREQIDACTELIVERWEDEGIDKLRLDKVGTFSLVDTPYGTVADRREFLKWIEETGQKDLLSVNASRVSALVKDALENGTEPPPGTSFFLKTEVRQYKS